MWNIGDKYITGHGSPIPRFSALTTNNFIVGSGETRRLTSGQYTFDTVEVQGTLSIVPGTKVQIRCNNFQILPSGVFDSRDAEVTITFKSDPLLSVDFHQIGRGLLNFGTMLMTGGVIEGENENARGHTIQLAGSRCDVRNVNFFRMGRTTTEPTDNSVVDDQGNLVHKGTNQIARYPWHWHHAVGAGPDHFQRISTCYVDGDNIVRWGYVVHGTSDVVVENCTADRCKGAGFALESGNEARVVLRNNVAKNCLGNGLKSNQQLNNNSPGSEGSGFWLMGTEGLVFEDNLGENNTWAGVNVFQQFAERGLIPEGPGEPPTISILPRRSRPASWRNNTFHNNRVGVELWGTPKGWLDVDTVAIGNDVGYSMGNGVAVHYELVNVLIDGAGTGKGIGNNPAYTRMAHVNGGVIKNCDVGFTTPIKFLLENVSFEGNELDIDVSVDNDDIRWIGEIRNCVLGGTKKIEFAEYYRNYLNSKKLWAPTVGSRLLLINHNGRNYQLYDKKQEPSIPAETDGRRCPEKGLTQWECWVKYGIGPRGGVCPEGYITLDGINGLALEYQGEANQIPPADPQVVLSNPVELVVGKNKGTLIGNRSFGNVPFMVQIGDEEPFERPFRLIPYRDFTFTLTELKPIKTWVKGQKETTLKTWFGTTPTPDPEPEPDPTCEELKAVIVSLEAELADLRERIQSVVDILTSQ